MFAHRSHKLAVISTLNVSTWTTWECISHSNRSAYHRHAEVAKLADAQDLKAFAVIEEGPKN